MPKTRDHNKSTSSTASLQEKIENDNGGRRILRRKTRQTNNIEKTKRFQCSLCNQRYRIEANFRKHMKINHNVTKSFMCNECGLKFKFEKELVHHVANHMHEFICGFCKFDCNAREKLIQHDKINHPDVENPILRPLD